MAKYKVKDIQSLVHIQRKSKKIFDKNGNIVTYQDESLNEYLLDSKEYNLAKSLDGSWLKGISCSLISLAGLSKIIYDLANFNPDRYVLESIADGMIALLSISSTGLAINELYPKINHLKKAKKYERLYNLYNSDVILK